MLTEKIIPRIESSRKSFTKKENYLADHLLKNIEEFASGNLSQLSQKLSIGEATIIRFCRKLGSSGFQDFKTSLLADIKIGNFPGEILDFEIKEKDDLRNAAEKIYHNNLKIMKDSIALMDQKELEAAVEIMKTADKVEFMGVGFSGLTALEAKYKFMRIGIKCDAQTDSQMMKISASLLKSGDLAIGISQSGGSQETVNALKKAKEMGACTIAITHYKDSAITEYADLVLINGSKEGPLQGGALSTKISQLFLMDILYTGVVMKDVERATQFKEVTTRD